MILVQNGSHLHGYTTEEVKVNCVLSLNEPKQDFVGPTLFRRTLNLKSVI